MHWGPAPLTAGGIPSTAALTTAPWRRMAPASYRRHWTRRRLAYINWLVQALRRADGATAKLQQRPVAGALTGSKQRSDPTTGTFVTPAGDRPGRQAGRPNDSGPPGTSRRICWPGLGFNTDTSSYWAPGRLARKPPEEAARRRPRAHAQFQTTWGRAGVPASTTRCSLLIWQGSRRSETANTVVVVHGRGILKARRHDFSVDPEERETHWPTGREQTDRAGPRQANFR